MKSLAILTAVMVMFAFSIGFAVAQDNGHAPVEDGDELQFILFGNLENACEQSGGHPPFCGEGEFPAESGGWMKIM